MMPQKRSKQENPSTLERPNSLIKNLEDKMEINQLQCSQLLAIWAAGSAYCSVMNKRHMVIRFFPNNRKQVAAWKV